jgi:hypothetical protein
LIDFFGAPLDRLTQKYRDDARFGAEASRKVLCQSVFQFRVHFLKKMANVKTRQLDKEIDEQIASSNAMLKSTLSTAKEAQDVGIKVAAQLASQREQLEKTDNNLSEIDASLNRSESLVNYMGSYFQWIWTSPSGVVKSADKKTVKTQASEGRAIAAEEEKRALAANEKIRNVQSRPAAGSGASSSADFVQTTKVKQALVEQDKQLDELAEITKGLRVLGEQIGDELDSQSVLLDRIDDKMDKTSNKAQRVTKKTEKLRK